MNFKIGSFNLKNLGLAALSDSNSRNLEKIAEIIRSENFDIVALQEILSEGSAIFSKSYAKDTLLWYLGPDWDFRWADAESSGYDPRHEEYAFIWNTQRMGLTKTKLDDSTVRVFNPRICRVKYDNMFRKPYYARFTPIDTFMEIRLLCVHTYFGKNDDEEDRKNRKREIDTLLKEIYPQVSGKIYKNDLPSYTIVLGDYNAELQREWHDKLQRPKKPLYIEDITVAHNWDDMKILTVQDQLTVLKNKQEEAEHDNTSSKEINRYSHNYDHFSYEDGDRYRELNFKSKRIDAVRKYENDDAEKYLKEVSNHLPIMLRFGWNVEEI